MNDATNELPVPAENPNDAENGKMNVILDYFETFILVLGCAFILLTFVFRICVVNGPSMEHSLFDGQRLLCSDLFYEPEYGDIIVFHQTGGRLNEPLIKRVIGVPGDVIDINFTSQVIAVNGQVLNESYAFYDATRPFIRPSATHIVVPEGYVFVMGDNRNNSTDSRSTEVGLVDQRRILGRVFLRVSPFTLY